MKDTIILIILLVALVTLATGGKITWEYDGIPHSLSWKLTEK